MTTNATTQHEAHRGKALHRLDPIVHRSRRRAHGATGQLPRHGRLGPVLLDLVGGDRRGRHDQHDHQQREASQPDGHRPQVRGIEDDAGRRPPPTPGVPGESHRSQNELTEHDPEQLRIGAQPAAQAEQEREREQHEDQAHGCHLDHPGVGHAAQHVGIQRRVQGPAGQVRTGDQECADGADEEQAPAEPDQAPGGPAGRRRGPDRDHEHRAAEPEGDPHVREEAGEGAQLSDGLVARLAAEDRGEQVARVDDLAPTDLEGERAGRGVPVLGDHLPRHDVGAVRDLRDRGDEDGRIVSLLGLAEGDLRARGVDQTDAAGLGRDRLVEVEDDVRRGGVQHRGARRNRGLQGGVGMGRGRRTDRQDDASGHSEQRQGEAAHPAILAPPTWIRTRRPPSGGLGTEPGRRSCEIGRGILSRRTPRPERSGMVPAARLGRQHRRGHPIDDGLEDGRAGGEVEAGAAITTGAELLAR